LRALPTATGSRWPVPGYRLALAIIRTCSPRIAAMTLSPLTALSPLDGRYAGKAEPLRPIFSEFGLMHRRVLVEVRWLLALVDEPGIAEVKALSAATRQFLMTIADGFSLQDAERIKVIERTTNHDVKAVEYFLKERIGDHAELRHGQGIRALRLHVRRHQQPRLCADAPRCARRRAAAGTRQADRDAPPDGARARRAADAVAYAWPDRSPTTLGNEIANVVARLQRQRAQIAGVSISAKINGAVGNYNATSSPIPKSTGRRLAASSRRSASSGMHTRRRSNRTTALPNSATQSAARTRS
jgi:adenylosuccinate lyase